MLNKLVSLSEEEELLELMDLCFAKATHIPFRKLLPKLYDPICEPSVHLGAYVEDRLIGSVGLYPVKLLSPYGSLNGICIGGVCVHPDFRGRGYFSQTMDNAIKLAGTMDADILFLSGKRERYNHFGFENAGRRFSFLLERGQFEGRNVRSFEVLPLEPPDKEALGFCLSLYNLRPQHAERDVGSLYKVLRSWNTKPYCVKVGGSLVGYFTLRDDGIVHENEYLEGYEEELFSAILSLTEKAYAETRLGRYNVTKLRGEYSTPAMFKIINKEKVISYLGSAVADSEKWESLGEIEATRKILGDASSNPKGGSMPFYISSMDLG